MCTEQLFLQDVATHEMRVLRDDGIYRHVRFKRPGSGCMHFDLVTYPGHLVYSGDMGCYVFSRIEDMFEFFRTDRDSPYLKAKGLTLGVNPSYWSEKLQAVDSHSSKPGATEFDPERFKSVINEYRLRWVRDAKADGLLTQEQRRELWVAVDDEVLAYVDEGEHGVFTRANEFSWSPDATQRLKRGRVYAFDDLFEHRFESYTFHFLWCCYAIAWGIRKYDDYRDASPCPIERAAGAVVEAAAAAGKVVSIEQVPRTPLAMGNVSSVVTVRQSLANFRASKP
jgi:hypothetical protein